MKTIKSLQNPLIKHLKLLRKNKKYRNEMKTVLVTGEKIIKELPPSQIKNFLTSNPKTPIKAKNTFLVTKEIMKKITNLKNPEDLAAEVFLKPFNENSILKKNFLLILDEIKDPGNLGTLIRTALCLKWDAIIITKNSVDPYNDKALRSAKGATFKIPIFLKSKKDINNLIKKKKYNAYIADVKGEKVENISFTPPLTLILGSESKGIDKKMLKIAKRITIPINKKTNSLNVAISGGILMYLIRKFS
jgi:TrmH family RNA methyltransferase